MRVGTRFQFSRIPLTCHNVSIQGLSCWLNVFEVWLNNRKKCPGRLDTCPKLCWPQLWLLWTGPRIPVASWLTSSFVVCISMMGEFAFDLRRFKGILVGFPHPSDVGPSASTISCGLMSMRPVGVNQVHEERSCCLGPALHYLFSLSGPSKSSLLFCAQGSVVKVAEIAQRSDFFWLHSTFHYLVYA